MALRAGYYGLKKKFIDKVNNWDNIVFPRSEQALLGAKNLLNFVNIASSPATIQGITWFINKNTGIIEARGSTTTNASDLSLSQRYGSSGAKLFLKNGNYIFTGLPDNASAEVWIGVTKSGSYSSLIADNDHKKKIVNFTVNGDDSSDDGANVQILLRIRSNTTIEGSLTFYPMIRLATDPDNIFEPYAATNHELTLSAADQKTAINAIISAATGAEDFAAFKTAMGAITPVTRSLSVAAPEEIVKDEIEESVVEKKTTTTKKSTAMAEIN